jgi:type I restriction enzyme, S subunit
MTPSTSNTRYWGGTIPWISSKDIKAPRLRGGTEFVTDEAITETRLRICPPGVVLVVMRSGVLAHTLPVAISSASVVINQDLKAFASSEPQLNEWLALALRANARDILHGSRKDGTTVQSVEFGLLKALEIPVAPLEEQRRIVAQVEALLARTAAASERLARIPAVLRRFRQSVLAAACSGRLTADWADDRADAFDGLPRGWKWGSAGDYYADAGRVPSSGGNRPPLLSSPATPLAPPG